MCQAFTHFEKKYEENELRTLIQIYGGGTAMSNQEYGIKMKYNSVRITVPS